MVHNRHRYHKHFVPSMDQRIYARNMHETIRIHCDDYIRVVHIRLVDHRLFVRDICKLVDDRAFDIRR